MAVTIERIGTALVLRLDNPPVNVIGAAVRQGLMAGLDAALSEGVDRVILIGTGKNFAAGADAKEFGAPPVPPHLPDVLDRIENFPVPCIAALNGTALGGGLEIALACRVRIAAPAARLGLPEVTLGVIPGAGGTQRLPRLIGLTPALDLISQGRLISGAEAHRLGLVDHLAEDTLPVALALPTSELAAAQPTSARKAPAADAAGIEAARKQAARKMPGQVAPQRAIDIVALSAALPLAEGLARERAAFLELRDGPQARALRHVFFAERRAAVQARDLAAAPVDVDQAVVVGGGNMGAGIAYALASAGVRVTTVETSDDAARRAEDNIARLYADAVKRGRTSADAAQATQKARHRFVVGYDALPPAQIAIEAAFEDLAVKQQIFAALQAALPPQAVLATNTSYLDINRIAEPVSDRSRVLGLHFFSPAHVMKLLEVIRAAQTSDAALATALKLAQRLGKIPVLAGICDGFIGNRILTRYRQTTDIVMIEGAMPWDIDAAMREFGFAMGPYEVQDLSGLDIAYANRKRLGLKTRPGFRYIPIADRMVEEAQRLGRKTSAGWYDYAQGQPASASPVVADLVRDTARAQGIAPRNWTSEEIQTRALTAMIEEACHILAEGIAARPADIDLVMLHGYGFPRWHGGLMHYADTISPAELLTRIEGFARLDPLSWKVPELLRRLARDGRGFDSLN
ncbi:3-hydroxyacyl-CoA dehydrogenase NAD-binding domain-containing protein [Pontitalea aquivivens]|uniref:3-hydroxyacyl-CoA dehydrogenase NAD-binding domain-containing protein n=1 Tax=Pontitalea aquivivens TaxID=3388663 RepID=UPI0039711436